LTTKTDGQGEHRVQVVMDEQKLSKRRVPQTVTLNVRVMDSNNQEDKSSTSFISYPCSMYVGLRCDKTYLLA